MYKIIKMARKNQGLTQLQLAQKASMSLATLQNIEAGRANPELATLQSLLKVLGYELTIKPKEINWSLLSSLGLPLMSSQVGGVLPYRSLLVQTLQECTEQLSQITKDSREELALSSFLFALRDHYPSVWRDLPEGLHLWLKKNNLGSVKLRRLSLQALGEYL